MENCGEGCTTPLSARSAGFPPSGVPRSSPLRVQWWDRALRVRAGRKRYAMDPWLIWLIVAAVLAVAEIFTLTAALGMLSAAALVTAGSAALGLSPPFQFLVFAVVATVTVLFVRPLAVRHVLQPQVARF